MNREEAIKLLALIKVAYPTAYKDMDNASKQATVNMWQTSFGRVPYPIMEMAFNHFRMVSKFPPTVAEMAEELKSLYFQAFEGAAQAKMFGTNEEFQKCRFVMQHTEEYRSGAYLETSFGKQMGNLLNGSQVQMIEKG